MGANTVALTFEGIPVRLTVQGPERGPVVLFAHPFPLDGSCWEQLQQACAAQGLRAAAVDQPGFGATPALGRPLTMDLQASVLAASLEVLGAEQATLVGCSMGGYALMAFARLFPARLSRAVLVCTKAAEDSAEAKAKRETQALTALAQGPLALTRVLLPNLVAPGLEQHDPDLFARVQALAQGATAQGLADALRGMALRPDSKPSLNEWPCPTLVIAGALDAVMPRPELETLAREIPQARLEVIEGAGHLAFLERPAETAQLLLAFLSAA